MTVTTITKKMFVFRLFIFVSCVTDATILELSTDRDIFEGQGVNFYCRFQQFGDFIFLDGPDSINTAIFCKNYTHCKSNYKGYFHDTVASNSSCMVFAILRPTRREEGIWKCLDKKSNKTVRLTLQDNRRSCVVPLTSSLRQDTTTTPTATGHGTKTMSITEHVFQSNSPFTNKPVISTKGEDFRSTLLWATNTLCASLYDHAQKVPTEARPHEDTVFPQSVTDRTVPRRTGVTHTRCSTCTPIEIPTSQTDSVSNTLTLSSTSSSGSSYRNTPYFLLIILVYKTVEVEEATLL